MMRYSALALNRPSSLPTRMFLLLITLAMLLHPAMATTVTYGGSTATQNFGTVNIGSSNSAFLTFSVSGGSIGSVEVVTQGAPNLDFTDASGGTCTGGTTTACTVDVTFKPIYAGLRRGAVLFWSGANNTGSVIGKTLIYGVGNGGQIVYLPAVTSLVATPSGLGSWMNPSSVALNGTGDLLVADNGNSRVVEIPVSGPATQPVPAGQNVPNPPAYSQHLEPLSFPNKSVVDGAGDLFIADTGNGRLVELPVGSPSTAAFGITALVGSSYFQYTYGVDVDGLGNLYVVDPGNYRVVKITSIDSTGTGTATAVDLQGHTLLYGSDVWLDAAGDLFISDAGFDFNNSPDFVPTNPQILEVHTNGSVSVVTAPGSGCAVEGPWSAEGDAAGNLFIGDNVPLGLVGGYETFGGRVVEYPAGGGNCIITTSFFGTTLGAGGAGMGEVNLSPSGDIYVSDLSGSRVIKEQRSVVPAVAFTHTTTAGTVDTTDGTRTVQIGNIGNQTLDFSGLTYPADFAAGSTSSQCTSSSSIAINGTCNVAIEFFPQNIGSLSENVVLTNNANGGSQSIGVTGTATFVAPQLTSPAPSSTLSSSSPTFTWNPGSATTFTFRMGSGAGAKNLYASGRTTDTSEIVNLPASGLPVYARLYYLVGSVWHWLDYTFTEAGSPTPPSMTLPAPTSTLTGSSQTFTWNAGGGPTAYELNIGTKGTGSSNIFKSGWINTTSVNATNIPTAGATLYVRLLYELNGVWSSIDYTYIEALQLPSMTTPAPTSTLTGSSQTFTWDPGGANAFELNIGSKGVGSSNVFKSGWINTTSTTAPTIPTTGGTLYVRLLYRINGVWSHIDYTYTEF